MKPSDVFAHCPCFEPLTLQLHMNFLVHYIWRSCITRSHITQCPGARAMYRDMCSFCWVELHINEYMERQDGARKRAADQEPGSSLLKHKDSLAEEGCPAWPGLALSAGCPLCLCAPGHPQELVLVTSLPFSLCAPGCTEELWHCHIPAVEGR